MAQPPQITQLLNQWSSGDKDAEAALTPIVYDELMRMAKRLFRSENSGHTLQPTALVHEAFVKLIDVDVDWQDRAHFYSLAARMMRRLLVNHANARRAEKRGGGAVKVTLDEANVGADAEADLLNLEEALQGLAALDERKANLIELQYFGGLSFREMEAVTGLSSSTIDRDLRLARAWLKDALAKN
ncbi:MAG: sigma-70 family RNA polymerase sigma factor [Gammaproteobacteria bacterium]|nr:sigma-70 family RNA polymerase sigma factor [Gammaproteobacteria bacterium]